MITVPLETWVSIATLLGVGLSLAALQLTTTRHLRTELKGDIAELRTEVKGDIAGLRTEVKGDIAELRTELKSDIAELRTELKSDIAELRTELKSDIAEQRTVVDRLDDRVYALATRQPPGPLIIPHSRP